jgi:hypothetical protein
MWVGAMVEVTADPLRLTLFGLPAAIVVVTVGAGANSVVNIKLLQSDLATAVLNAVCKAPA